MVLSAVAILARNQIDEVRLAFRQGQVARARAGRYTWSKDHRLLLAIALGVGFCLFTIV